MPAAPKLQCAYYAYWADLPMDGRYEAYMVGDRAFAAWPTNDGLTVVIGALPMRDFAANRADIEGGYLATIARVPAFAERTASATRTGRLVGTAVPNYFRVPYGPGWALVGDAGYLKDFITGHGIQDAMDGFARVNAGLTTPGEFFSDPRLTGVPRPAG
ncbi:hypothetical protein [Streptomyces sp. NPDC002054]|uniref:hypothetical protein n=1 Tax=Streptomyces sp. NPDC002054 TaxID=3154663 RepID=UPI003320BD81